MSYNRIFLSHRSVDKEMVREYRDTLESMGYRTWMDEYDLRAGDRLERSLQKGMAMSCAVVFFITPEFKDEEYLRLEIDQALRHYTARGDGFRIITLVFGEGDVEVPEPLMTHLYKTPKTPLEGIRTIVRALPHHLSKTCAYLPMPDVVPEMATEVALVGQNLATRTGNDEERYCRFRDELKKLLSRKSLKKFVLVAMTPKALLAIHREAAQHLARITLRNLHWLREDLADSAKVLVAFHPSATLSMLAVDWDYPDRAFALIVPKFQRTSDVEGRVHILMDNKKFDSKSLERMLGDIQDRKHGAISAPLTRAPGLLESRLKKAGLQWFIRKREWQRPVAQL